MLTYKAIYKKSQSLKDAKYPMFCKSTETWVCSSPAKARRLAEHDCPQGYEIYRISTII